MEERLEQLVAQFGNPAELEVRVGRNKAWPLREGKVVSPEWVDKLELALNEPGKVKGIVDVSRGGQNLYRVSNGTVDVDERDALETLTQLESLPEPPEPVNGVEVQPEYLELLNSRFDRVGQENWTLDELREDVEQGRTELGDEFVNDFDNIVIREGLERGLSREQTLAVLDRSPTLEGLPEDEVARYRTQFENQYNGESARRSGGQENSISVPEDEAVQDPGAVNVEEDTGFPEDLAEDENLIQDEGMTFGEVAEIEDIEPEDSALSSESRESPDAASTETELEDPIDSGSDPSPEPVEPIAAEPEIVTFPGLDADLTREVLPVEVPAVVEPVSQSDLIPSDFGLDIAQGYDMDAANQLGGSAPREYAALDALRTQINEDRSRMQEGADWLQGNPEVLANETRYTELRSALESRLTEAVKDGRWTSGQTVSVEPEISAESSSEATQDAVPVSEAVTEVVPEVESAPQPQVADELIPEPEVAQTPVAETIQESSPSLDVASTEISESVETEDSWSPVSEAEKTEIEATIENQLADYEVDPEAFETSDVFWDGPTTDELDAAVDRSLAYYEAEHALEYPQSIDTETVLSNESIGESKPDLDVASTENEPFSTSEPVPESIPAIHTVEPISPVYTDTINAYLESQDRSPLAQSLGELKTLADVNPEGAKDYDRLFGEGALAQGMSKDQFEQTLTHSPYVLSELERGISFEDVTRDYIAPLATTYESSQIAQVTESINKPLDVPLDLEAQQTALAEHFSFPPEALNQADVFNGAFAAAEPRLQSLQDGFASVEFEIKNLAQHINEGKFSDWASNQGKRIENAAQTIDKNVKGRLSQWVNNAKTSVKTKVQDVGQTVKQTVKDKFEKAIALVDSEKLERISPILPSQVDNYKIETEQGLRISRDGVSVYEDGKCSPGVDSRDVVFMNRLSERAEKQVSSMVEGLATLGGEAQPNGDRAFSVGAYTMSRSENGAVKLSEASRGEILHSHNGKTRSLLTSEDYSRFQKFQQNTQVAVKAPALAKGGIELG